MEKEYIANKTKKKVEINVEQIEVSPSQKILEETTKNFVNTVNSNVNIEENEWKEKCKKFMETK